MQLSEIAVTEQTCSLQCGERFVRSWRQVKPDDISESDGIALGLIHGLGDHCGRYDQMARWFASRGIDVYALDLLGHGNSPGEKLTVPNYEALLEDVESLLAYVCSRHSGSTVGLFGQSMGGNLVLNHQLRGYSRPAFVIAGSPMLRSVNQPGAITMLLMRLLSYLRPNYRLQAEADPVELSRDPEMQRAFLEDPLVQRGITLRLARFLIDSGGWALEFASRLQTATLLTHGSDDRITCHEASIEFGKRSPDNVTTKIWPGGKHDLHHDVVRDQYFASLLEWIGSTAQGSQTAR